MSSVGALPPRCFQLATTSWLTSPLVCTAATSSGLHEVRRRTKTHGIGNSSFEVLIRGSCSSRRHSTAFHMRGSSTSVGLVTGIPSATRMFRLRRRLKIAQRAASVKTRSSAKSVRNTNRGDDSASSSDGTSGSYEVEDHQASRGSRASSVSRVRGDRRHFCYG